MVDFNGLTKPPLPGIPRIVDRTTFLYLEHCQINRKDGAITARDKEGTVYIPAASISVLLLGPGTNITHRAVELIGDAGVSLVWVGEQGVRFYASGRPLTHRSDLLIQQAKLVSNQRSHLAVARKMYQLRFPREDVSRLSMQQLRGREGHRVRSAYRAAAERWGVPWNGRSYDPNNFSAGDPANQALSVGNVCLYGLTHAVISALGCSPALGFVHVGQEQSFVYDIGDLYKAEITIPIAFEIASKTPQNLPSEVRRRVRDEMFSRRILQRMVQDIHWLLSDDLSSDTEILDSEVMLWDDAREFVSAGRSHGLIDSCSCI